MATAPVAGSDTFGNLFQQLVGQQQAKEEKKTEKITNAIDTVGTSSGTNASTSKQNQTQVQKTTADLGALESVFAKQSAGVTPEMLNAIFMEGSKAVPGLVNATANAVGARSGGNSASTMALTGLNAELAAKAATINQQMLADSGTTAARIAELTKAVSTTGSTTQNQSGTTTNKDTKSQDQTQSTTGLEQGKTASTVNEDMTGKLLLGLLGGSGLNSLLQGAGVGGIGGAGSAINELLKGAGGGIANLFKGFMGDTGGPGQALVDSWAPGYSGDGPSLAEWFGAPEGFLGDTYGTSEGE